MSIDPLPWILGSILGGLLFLCILFLILWHRQQSQWHDNKMTVILPSFDSSSTPFDTIELRQQQFPSSKYQRIYRPYKTYHNPTIRESNILSSERSIVILEDQEYDDDDIDIMAWKTIESRRGGHNLIDVRHSLVSEASYRSFELTNRGCEFVDPSHRAKYLQNATNKYHETKSPS